MTMQNPICACNSSLFAVLSLASTMLLTPRPRKVEVPA